MNSPLSEGSLFAEKYRVLGVLGEGGMGTVYLAEQLATRKRRALKLMRGALAYDAEAATRFVAEARVGALVESDHIVEVVDAGVDSARGVPWLAMEYLEGRTLADRIAEGPIPFDELQEMMRQLAHGLGRAHAAGLVHRDLKPENIYLAVPRREGVPFTVKVLDFGIAKLIDDGKASAAGPLGGHTTMRATGACGTPLWMAPEQVRRGAVTPAADVWAIGLITFAALTGANFWRAAYARESSLVGLLTELTLDPLPAASARATDLGRAHLLPASFDGWFARCVTRDPSHRFADADRAIRGLQTLARRAVIQSAGAALASDVGLGATVASSPLGPEPVATGLGATVDSPLAPSPAIALTPTRAGPTHPIAGSETNAPADFRVAAPSEVARPGRSGAAIALVALGTVSLLGIAALAAALWARPAPGAERGHDAAPVTDPSSTSAGSPAPGDDALPPLERACAAGDFEACAQAGIPHTHGDGVPRDYARALGLYRRACDGGSGLGCTNLGYAHEAGWGVPEDISAAASLYERACDLGDPAGCDLLGRRHLEGRGASLDPARALALFTQACDGGDPAGCDELGRMLETGIGVPADLARARLLYERGCEGGQAESCASLGRLLAHGLGGPVDPARARAMRERACENGDATGCNDLGDSLEREAIGPEDLARARELYDRACAGGVALGCRNLAELYERGVGAERDAARANALYLRACQLGLQAACGHHVD